MTKNNEIYSFHWSDHVCTCTLINNVIIVVSTMIINKINVSFNKKKTNVNKMNVINNVNLSIRMHTWTSVCDVHMLIYNVICIVMNVILIQNNVIFNKKNVINNDMIHNLIVNHFVTSCFCCRSFRVYT